MVYVLVAAIGGLALFVGYLLGTQTTNLTMWLAILIFGLLISVLAALILVPGARAWVKERFTKKNKNDQT